MSSRTEPRDPSRRPAQAVPAGGIQRPLLEVRGLRTEFPSTGSPVVPVDDVTLSVGKGETLGLVGESGSGKTMTLMSIAGLVPKPGTITSGRVNLEGEDLTKLSAADLRAVRGSHIGIVFQDPMTSLNPTLPIGFQVSEPLRVHRGLSRRDALREAEDMLAAVGIPRPRERMGDYPHQFSGGMRQRVMIAAALVCRPKLVLADEPTTALDVTVQAQILELLASLSQETSTTLILVTHDLGVAAAVCDSVAVMYAGQVVENGTVEDVFYTPEMPYTAGLIACMPSVDDEPGTPLVPIPGLPPDISELPSGCRFVDRCRHARSECSVVSPVLTPRRGTHLARCLGTEQGGWIHAEQ